MADSHVKQANTYAKTVKSGKIPACKWVVAACSRYINDLQQQKKDGYPYLFDKKKAERYCDYVEMFPHVKGKWAGDLIVLEPWQSFILCNIFGWLRKTDGLRRFRELYCEVPRKNGKSILLAAIGLVMAFLDDEPGAEVYSGASTEKQAWEVFSPAKLMAAKAKDFEKEMGLVIHAKNISVTYSGSKFEPLIGNPGDGASPHCAIVDEFHEHDKPNLYDTMLTGMGARTQPLLACITTAGTNLAGPCYDKRDQVCKMLDGVIENEELFGVIYTLDVEDEWTDIENWKKANPNYGISVFEDFLQSRLQEAVQRASRQNIIRCKHLNQWMNADSAWMNMLSWDKCADNSLFLTDFEGETCYIGLDLASKVDIASMVVLFRRDDQYYCFCRHYLPEDTIQLPENAHYQGWSNAGLLVETPGPIIDFGYIEDDLLDFAKRFDIAEIPYDPHQATQLSTRMMEEGLPMVEYRQIVLNMSEPMKELEALVLDGRFHFNGDPVLSWMASNVVAHYDVKDNTYPRKQRVQNKIDGMVALIMAVGRAMKGEGQGQSVYEDRGVLVI